MPSLGNPTSDAARYPSVTPTYDASRRKEGGIAKSDWCCESVSRGSGAKTSRADCSLQPPPGEDGIGDAHPYAIPTLNISAAHATRDFGRRSAPLWRFRRPVHELDSRPSMRPWLIRTASPGFRRREDCGIRVRSDGEDCSVDIHVGCVAFAADGLGRSADVRSSLT